MSFSHAPYRFLSRGGHKRWNWSMNGVIALEVLGIADYLFFRFGIGCYFYCYRWKLYVEFILNRDHTKISTNSVKSYGTPCSFSIFFLAKFITSWLLILSEKRNFVVFQNFLLLGFRVKIPEVIFSFLRKFRKKLRRFLYSIFKELVLSCKNLLLSFYYFYLSGF